MDKWEGIIELQIAEWIMDYGISPKEKRGERRRRKWREGVCERRMLCDAAVG